ncbi:hypothetical protein BpHYR1_000180 [Brachionus plicatilis]|uniref:Uncharacterized protein n=1 Tax=Brachionus plicatilis TaxID=10195 RepID=A0A3M7R4P5_BRAPC|nr:hypothetical protein BpHYR1_000180 [Brachionus plicatilis]
MIKKKLRTNSKLLIEFGTMAVLTQNSKLINDNHYTIHHSSLHHATILYNFIRHAADLPFSATHCNDSENLDSF